MNEDTKAACAHLNVKQSTVQVGDGRVRDRWKCQECGHEFVPMARLETRQRTGKGMSDQLVRTQLENRDLKSECSQLRARAQTAERERDEAVESSAAMFKKFDSREAEISNLRLLASRVVDAVRRYKGEAPSYDERTTEPRSDS